MTMPTPTSVPITSVEALCRLNGVNYDAIIWHSQIVPTFSIVDILAEAARRGRLEAKDAATIMHAFAKEGWDVTTPVAS